MNGGAPEHEFGFDWVSLLLNAGIVATFVVFAVALWLVKREAGRKKAQPPDTRPPD